MSPRRKALRFAAVAAALVACAALTFPLVAAETPCAAAKLSKGRYCPKDKIVLEKGKTLGEGPTYVCAVCGKKARKEGECTKCKQALTAEGAPKGACTQCGTMSTEVTVCVKTYFACPECGSKRHKAGKCPGCKKTLKKQTSQALVEFSCAGCGDVAAAKGKCTKEGCESAGKPLTKRCTASGTFPHIAVEKAKKEKQPKEKKPRKKKEKKKK